MKTNDRRTRQEGLNSRVAGKEHRHVNVPAWHILMEATLSPDRGQLPSYPAYPTHTLVCGRVSGGKPAVAHVRDSAWWGGVMAKGQGYIGWEQVQASSPFTLHGNILTLFVSLPHLDYMV